MSATASIDEHYDEQERRKRLDSSDPNGAAQRIIDKELNDSSRNHPDGFPGQDYYPSKIEVDEYCQGFGKENNEPPLCNEVDFDPNHDVEKQYPWERRKSSAYDVQPEDFPPLVSPEDEAVIKKFYRENPFIKSDEVPHLEVDNGGPYRYNPNDAWIQTYSGRRFTPTNPNPDAVVIQDIAHSLSMQCRFGGHSAKFYSVAQHCVLVSYICNFEDAFWGLMHDASEAYLVDVPRPIKRSGKMDSYLDFEDKVQAAICKRFGLSEKEPVSVKRADKILLSTEARDLLANLRSDWTLPEQPLPFKIVALEPRQAKDLFMKRFFELTNMPGAYEHYLTYENKKVI